METRMPLFTERAEREFARGCQRIGCYVTNDPRPFLLIQGLNTLKEEAEAITQAAVILEEALHSEDDVTQMMFTMSKQDFERLKETDKLGHFDDVVKRYYEARGL